MVSGRHAIPIHLNVVVADLAHPARRRLSPYLVGLALYILAFTLVEGLPRGTGSWSLPRLVVMSALALLSACALLDRAKYAVVRAPQGMRNINEQEYQMGLFLREHYQGAKVTAVDVGAINYLADIRCLDADGLASRESLELKIARALSPEAIASMARGSRLAFLYKRFIVQRGLPAGWTKVGSWMIPNNVVCGDATVWFHATDGNDPEEL